MSKVMNFIAKETNGKSYNTFKYSYDRIGLPTIDYDQDDKIMKWKESGETIKRIHSVTLKILADKIVFQKPIISYFLDGSRRVFKVDDISYNKQVFPVVAGQIGIGCCSRTDKKMQKVKFNRSIVLTLPDKSYVDLWSKSSYYEKLKNDLNNDIKTQAYSIKFDKILPYNTMKNADIASKEIKLEDRAIVAIQNYMIEAEKQMVADLVKENKLDQNNYLLKDGSLEYKTMSSGKTNLRELYNIKNNYNWVIGVSKSFNPESCLDHTGKPNSNYIADLPIYHRTPVARYQNSYSEDVQFAVWYIRIREKSRTLTPFDGVVKVEKILMDDEIENGVDSDEIDLISANLINERNPTCYGKDNRWANHLYPVYLTETFVKSQYISNEMFLHIF